MATFNTRNPLGSTAAKDLYDNAQNLDIAANDLEKDTWVDRFGRERATLSGQGRAFDFFMHSSSDVFQQFLINSGYQNIGDYGAGLEITARNQIFWKDGELYRAGAVMELPYTTTGVWENEESLFVAVGDQALRQELSDGLSLELGASMVGRATVAVESIAELLQIKRVANQHISVRMYGDNKRGGGLFYWDPVSVEEPDGGTVFSVPGVLNGRWKRSIEDHVSFDFFGIDLTGNTESDEKVNAAFAAAEKAGVPVRQYGGVALVSGSQTINISSDAEFGGDFKFRVTAQPTVDFLFDVVANDYEAVTLTQSDVNISEFKKYENLIPSLSGYPYHYAVIKSSDLNLYRIGGQRYNNGSVTIIGRDGSLVYPLTSQFTSISNITLTPINVKQRYVRGFTLEGVGGINAIHPIRVRRNRVLFESPRYIDHGTTQLIPVRQMFTLDGCCGFSLTDPVCDSLSDGQIDYNYVVNGEYYALVRVSGMQSFEGWAQIDGSYTRDILIENSIIDRAGGHFLAWDYSFRNITSKRSNPISISGGGRLSVEDIRIRPYALPEPNFNPVVDIRSDYGAEWDGSIDIRGVEIDCRGLVNAGSVSTFYGVHAYLDSRALTHDFGRTIVFPRDISIKDVSLLADEASTYSISFQSVRLGVGGAAIGGSRLISYPRKVVIRDIKHASVNRAFINPLCSLLVLGTSPSVGGRMQVEVENVDFYDPRLYGLNPYDTGQPDGISISAVPNLDVSIRISNCDWLRMAVGLGAKAFVHGCNVAAIAGAGEVALFDCDYSASSFSGSWKGVMNGGRLLNYLNTSSEYSQVGYPNNIETNIVAAKNVFVQNNANIRSLTQTTSTIQTGFVNPSFYKEP